MSRDRESVERATKAIAEADTAAETARRLAMGDPGDNALAPAYAMLAVYGALRVLADMFVASVAEEIEEEDLARRQRPSSG